MQGKAERLQARLHALEAELATERACKGKESDDLLKLRALLEEVQKRKLSAEAALLSQRSAAQVLAASSARAADKHAAKVQLMGSAAERQGRELVATQRQAEQAKQSESALEAKLVECSKALAECNGALASAVQDADVLRAEHQQLVSASQQAEARGRSAAEGDLAVARQQRDAAYAQARQLNSMLHSDCSSSCTAVEGHAQAWHSSRMLLAPFLISHVCQQVADCACRHLQRICSMPAGVAIARCPGRRLADRAPDNQRGGPRSKRMRRMRHSCGQPARHASQNLTGCCACHVGITSLLGRQAVPCKARCGHRTARRLAPVSWT